MRELRLVIGNKNYSSWSLCPWLLLKMFDVEFEEVKIELYQDNTAERLGPYSPSLKVPVLLHKEITVWDSLSICEYLSEQILNGSAWPATPKCRASARSTSAEIHSDFPNLKRDCPMNCKVSYQHRPSDILLNEIARVDAIWSCCRRKFGENGNYLYGRFSIADCMYAPVAIIFDSYGVELSGEASTYMKVLLDNPFVQRWISEARAEQELFPIACASNG